MTDEKLEAAARRAAETHECKGHDNFDDCAVDLFKSGSNWREANPKVTSGDDAKLDAAVSRLWNPCVLKARELGVDPQVIIDAALELCRDLGYLEAEAARTHSEAKAMRLVEAARDVVGWVNVPGSYIEHPILKLANALKEWDDK